MPVETTLKRRMSPRLRRKRTFDHGEPIAKIDTRPMAFVALFLAIVFLIPANQTRVHALEIDLPFWDPTLEDLTTPEYVTVRITSDGVILIDDVEIELGELAQAISERNELGSLVAFHPDGNAAYGLSASVLNEIVKGKAGSSSICLIGMEQHRYFDRTAFWSALSLGPNNAKGEWQNITTVIYDIPPCALLMDNPFA